MKYYKVKILAKGRVFREDYPVDPTLGTTVRINISEHPPKSEKIKPKKSFVEKKYYSASEITKVLGIALHQLRYLETKVLNLSNYKIRGRKYYTANDHNLLQDHLSINKKLPRANLSEQVNSVSLVYKEPIVTPIIIDESANNDVGKFTSIESINRIDTLLAKFNDLSLQIKKILADTHITCL